MTLARPTLINLERVLIMYACKRFINEYSKCILRFLMIGILMNFTTQIRAENHSVFPGESIQLAIDDVSVFGGGIVTLKAGTHHISELIKIKSSVTLEGEGTFASTLKTDSNIKMIEEHKNGLVNVTIQNL